jgi:hypothetical protein
MSIIEEGGALRVEGTLKKGAGHYGGHEERRSRRRRDQSI